MRIDASLLDDVQLARRRDIKAINQSGHMPQHRLKRIGFDGIIDQQTVRHGRAQISDTLRNHVSRIDEQRCAPCPLHQFAHRLSVNCKLAVKYLKSIGNWASCLHDVNSFSSAVRSILPLGLVGIASRQ